MQIIEKQANKTEAVMRMLGRLNRRTELARGYDRRFLLSEVQIISVCGAAIALHFFAGDINVSGYMGYYVLFRNSGICTVSQSWAGLRENIRTREVLDKFAAASALQSVDNSGFQEWSGPFGTIWFPPSASPSTVHFALAQFEIGAYPGIQIHSGDIIMDCGGYVGDWTKWVLQASAAKVIIIEPAHDALECIYRNLKEDIYQGRVVLYPKGVLDREGTMHLRARAIITNHLQSVIDHYIFYDFDAL